MRITSLLIYFLTLFSTLRADQNEVLDWEDSSFRLFRDLEIVEKVDKKIKESLPFLFNYMLEGGYFTMPSARMKKGGNIAFGFSYLPPYRLYSLNFQYFDHVELSGNYWIFHGMKERNFGHLGFGSDADRAANIKLSLLQQKDGISWLPEFAVGVNDFMGSRRFHSIYVVTTKELLDQNLELSVGWARGRMRGLWGGIAWSPCRCWDNCWKGLTLAAEYDCNNYKRYRQEHPKGRKVKSYINAGVHFQLMDYLHLSLSSIRGKKIGGSVSLNYNLGDTTGIFPKYLDSSPESIPIDMRPLGQMRSIEEFTLELAYSAKKEGLELYKVVLSQDKEGTKSLWIKIINVKYYHEEKVREHLENILSALIPADINRILVVVEVEGLEVHQYFFRREDLIKYKEGYIGSCELQILSPLQDVARPPSFFDFTEIYHRKKKIWMWTFRPLVISYFGSAKGKFKYDVGFISGPQGYLLDNLFYDLQASYILKSSSSDVGDRDMLNPSRVVNVRSDSVRYNQSNSFHIDRAYLQKNWNMGRGLFSRFSWGYFEIAYAGIAAELLYNPINSKWALGWEMAAVLKRKYSGLGFQHKIRKIKNNVEQFTTYWGLQYFVDLYFPLPLLDVDFKVSIGQFLARDKGVRLEMKRSFASGLSLSFWYTFTNGRDVVNGKRYFDRGFLFSLPLDIFMNKSSRTRISYAMSAWLRDVGARAKTGKELFHIIYQERN